MSGSRDLTSLAARAEAGERTDELWKLVSAAIRKGWPAPAGGIVMIYWPDVARQLRALAAQQQDRPTEGDNNG